MILRLSKLSIHHCLSVAPWRKFYVHLAGSTQGTHLPFLAAVRELDQTEVFSPEDSDYVVAFCPIVSPLETDVSEALHHIPGEQPLSRFGPKLLC